MPRITIMRGLPASGKSTEARLIVEKRRNTVRVNRDDLRKMVYNGGWSGPREKVIIAIEQAIAARALEQGQNVVVDDTNLTTSALDMWLGFAKEHDIDVESRFIDTPLNECIERDATRYARVGRAVIEGMALKAGLIPFEPVDKQLVLVDMDGTLSDLTHRLPYVKVTEGGKKNWELFFKLCPWDKVRLPVAAWVRELYKDHIVCIVSGRPEDKCQGSTECWLEKYQIPFHHLFMRRGGDKRDDTIIKEAILSYLPKERIAFVIDDRPRVVEMWRKNGLRVFPVGGYEHYW